MGVERKGQLKDKKNPVKWHLLSKVLQWQALTHSSYVYRHRNTGVGHSVIY